jgi:hypothetical protein
MGFLELVQGLLTVAGLNYFVSAGLQDLSY